MHAYFLKNIENALKISSILGQTISVQIQVWIGIKIQRTIFDNVIISVDLAKF